MLGETKRAVEPLRQPVATVPSSPGDQATSSSDDQSPSSAVVERYEKTSAFLTPDQRRWLKSTVRSLPVDGLSVSDVIRLAVDQLRESVDGGLPLVELLTSRAYADAERFAGRRNRGLPERLSY
jgi:hypothetical protein